MAHRPYRVSESRAMGDEDPSYYESGRAPHSALGKGRRGRVGYSSEDEAAAVYRGPVQRYRPMQQQQQQPRYYSRNNDADDHEAIDDDDIRYASRYHHHDLHGRRDDASPPPPPPRPRRQWDPSPARPNGLARSTPRHRRRHDDEDEEDSESMVAHEARGRVSHHHRRRGRSQEWRSDDDDATPVDVEDDRSVPRRHHHRHAEEGRRGRVVAEAGGEGTAALPHYTLDPYLDPASREERAVAKELKRALLALRDTQKQTAELLALAKLRTAAATNDNDRSIHNHNNVGGVVHRPITLHVIHHHAIGVATNADGTTRVELSPGRAYNLEMSSAVQDAVVGTVKQSYVTVGDIDHGGQVVHHSAAHVEYAESSAPPSVHAAEHQHYNHAYRYGDDEGPTRVIYTAQPYNPHDTPAHQVQTAPPAPLAVNPASSTRHETPKPVSETPPTLTLSRPAAAVPVESAPPAQRQPSSSQQQQLQQQQSASSSLSRPLPPKTRPSPAVTPAATPTNRGGATIASEEIVVADTPPPPRRNQPPPPPPPPTTATKKQPPPPPPPSEQRHPARSGTPVAIESIPGSRPGSRTGSVSSQQRGAAPSSREPALVAASTSYPANHPPPPLVRQ